ncbi:unnamed protein product [Arabidopsis thaliana]|uniref:Uncharacterized protein n=1 Tax=Arabidopsis thaliana TaxID=3702 RepID=A0A5S9WKK0_ARATH|nr:unnamed protein product [Arabidopsis thaliana]
MRLDSRSTEGTKIFIGHWPIDGGKSELQWCLAIPTVELVCLDARRRGVKRPPRVSAINHYCGNVLLYFQTIWVGHQ